MPASRFAPEVDRLRAILHARQGADLIAHLQSEMEHLPTAALAADSAQRYVASNAAARALTGYTETELTDLTVMDLTPVASTDDGGQLWETFIGMGDQHGEYELVQKSGAQRHVRYWAFASVAPGVHISLLVPVEM